MSLFCIKIPLTQTNSSLQPWETTVSGRGHITNNRHIEASRQLFNTLPVVFQNSCGQLNMKAASELWCGSARVTDTDMSGCSPVAIKDGSISVRYDEELEVCSRFRTADCSTGWPWASEAAPPHGEPRPWCPPGQSLHLHPTWHHSWQDNGREQGNSVMKTVHGDDWFIIVSVRLNDQLH